MRLLVVCLGNICRSPMAEGWLSARIAQTPDLAGRIEVDSAGLGRWHVGDPPDPRAIATAAAHGIDISGQRARRHVEIGRRARQAGQAENGQPAARRARRHVVAQMQPQPILGYDKAIGDLDVGHAPARALPLMESKPGL